MLHHFSWAAYLKFMGGLLIVYYLYVFLKYFRSDSGKARLTNTAGLRLKDLPDPFQRTDEPVYKEATPGNQPDFSHAEADRLIEEADQFIALAKKFIQNAASKPFSPEPLQINLKNIFKSHADLRTSPHRPAINELVVSECERTGTARLTEDEVDRWWDDR